MRRLGGRTGWLGWVVAGVLLVSAGGAALAAQSATPTTQAQGAGADKAKARAGALGRAAGWRHALGRRVLHGEVTVQTKDGVKTVIMATVRRRPMGPAYLPATSMASRPLDASRTV